VINLITRSKKIYRIGTSVKNCGTMHRISAVKQKPKKNISVKLSRILLNALTINTTFLCFPSKHDDVYQEVRFLLYSLGQTKIITLTLAATMFTFLHVTLVTLTFNLVNPKSIWIMSSPRPISM